MKCDKGLLAVGLTLALVFGGCPAPETSTPKHTDQDLLIGYELLASAVHEESRLKLLKLLKKITFRGPIDEVNDLISVIETYLRGEGSAQ
jgi:hypothetical protein